MKVIFIDPTSPKKKGICISWEAREFLMLMVGYESRLNRYTIRKSVEWIVSYSGHKYQSSETASSNM